MPETSGIQPPICPAQFRVCPNYIPKATLAHTQHESYGITLILEALEHFESFDRQSRVKAIADLAQDLDIPEIQLWHIRSLMVGGAS